MKAIAKQLATITFISLLLLGLNVKAEGTETTALKNENIEMTLELENWMTDETIWNTNSAMFVEIETESELTMEEWMTNNESWNIYFDVEEDTEADLMLENWMTNDSNWFILSPVNDPELDLEAWMTNEIYWK